MKNHFFNPGNVYFERKKTSFDRNEFRTAIELYVKHKHVATISSDSGSKYLPTMEEGVIQIGKIIEGTAQDYSGFMVPIAEDADGWEITYRNKPFLIHFKNITEEQKQTLRTIFAKTY